MLEYDRKKDANPIRTVERARRILADLEVLSVETWKNYYDPAVPEPKSLSVRVDLPACGVGSNGKGTKRSYALASAYGELMERLQNLILLPVERFDRESLEKEGFLYFPDERTVSVDEVVNADDCFSRMVYRDFYRERLMLECGPEERRRVVEAYLETESRQADDKLITWPFYSVKEDRSIDLWNRFVSYLHGSNGMCAGNTPAEALVQGLSEIFERYASTQVLAGGIIPPDIPAEEYRRYAGIAAQIDEIEAMGPFRILVKDCSLGLKLPVCAVILVDNNRQRYCCSFGCHPNLPVAVERCLTELLQGYTPNAGEEDSRLLPLDTDARGMDPYLNVHNMHCNGMGILPPGFFTAQPSYAYSSFEDMSGADNMAMLRFCIDLALGIAPDVMIRDVSYLGFPAYQIIVPGISHYPTTQRLLRMDAAYASLQDLEYYRTHNDPASLKRLLVGLNRHEHSSAKPELRVPACRLKIAALMMLKDYSGLCSYLEYRMRLRREDDDFREISALMRVAAALHRGLDLENVRKELALFYPEGMWERICTLWLCENPIARLLDAADAGKNKALDREANALFCRLKRVYAQKRIHQEDLRTLFYDGEERR